jgi:hypothetical protein
MTVPQAAQTSAVPNMLVQQVPVNRSVGSVPSIQAAMSMPMAPNSELFLFVENSDVFCMKKSDANGRIYPLEIYDYKQRVEEVQPAESPSSTQYATKDDVRQILHEELSPFLKQFQNGNRNKLQSKEVSKNV